jgi:prophage antirepressor-like protein
MVSGLAALVFLRMVVNDHGNLFVAAETVHAIGLYVPIYKLMKENTCAGNTYETSLSASSFFSLYRFMSILHYDLERFLLVFCKW